MRKYFQIFASYLKQAMAYRVDALLSASLSIVAILFQYLLWKMLIPADGTLNGYTLPDMVTYSLLSTALAPFILSTDAMFSFTGEIRSGTFAKYLYTPISPFGAFASCSLATALPKSICTIACCAVWSLLFQGMLTPLSLEGMITALPFLLLMIAFVILMNYLITCLAFRFTDVLGVILIRGTLITFFSGGLAPLEILFGYAPTGLPFYYLIGYPAQLMMRRAVVQPGLACAVMGGYTLLTLFCCIGVTRRSRVYFEGVGA